MIDIMIDLETTGTEPGCRILEIGACSFQYDANMLQDRYHILIDPGSQEIFTDNPDTINWWSKQDRFPQVFAGVEPLDYALADFSSWLMGFNDDISVWGNAASFDLKILEKAYKLMQIEVPWKYYNEMCYRTLKNLYPEIKIMCNPHKHEALQDAIYQAEHAVRILNTLKFGRI